MRSQAFLCFGLACGVAGVLAGCGSGSPGGLSASGAGTLRQQLAAVDNAAAHGDRAAALNALSTFAADVQRDAGALNAAQRSALQTGIARVRARIQGTLAVNATSGTTSTTTPTVTTTTTTTTVAAPTPTSAAPTTTVAAPTPHGRGPGGQGPPGHEGHGGPPGHDHHHNGDPGGGPGGHGPGGGPGSGPGGGGGNQQ